MKIYKNDSDSIRVGTYEENGKYYIIVERVYNTLVATKHSRKPHVEEMMKRYEREFDNKDKANNYFKAIKRNNPTLKAL